MGRIRRPNYTTRPKSKNTMKLTFALVVVLFAAATLAEECQIYRGAVEKLAVEISSRQARPESLSAPDGVCEDGEGWACSGEIVNVVMECIAGIGTGNPLGIYQCVMDAIGAGSDCADCVCWVMSFVEWIAKDESCSAVSNKF